MWGRDRGGGTGKGGRGGGPACEGEDRGKKAPAPTSPRESPSTSWARRLSKKARLQGQITHRVRHAAAERGVAKGSGGAAGKERDSQLAIIVNLDLLLSPGHGVGNVELHARQSFGQPKFGNSRTARAHPAQMAYNEAYRH